MNDNFREHLTEKSHTVYVIIIDEWGDTGLKTDRDPFFIIGAVVTDKPEKLASVSRALRDKYGFEEIKYHNLGDKKGEAERMIAAEDPMVFGVYIDKCANDNPYWWYRYKNHRSKVHRKVLAELAKDIMISDLDNLVVIIDHNTSLKKEEGANIIRNAAENKKNIIYVKQEDSERGIHKDLLQAGEIAIGAMGRTIRDGIEPEIIIMVTRRLTFGDRKK